MAAALSSMDLSQTPAGTPPAGVTPDLYGNPPSLQSTIKGFCALFYVVTTVVVSLRMYSVFRSAQKVAADDVLCLLAVVCTFAYMAFLIHLSYAARHMWDVPLSWLYSDPEYWKLRLAQNLFNPLAFFFSRAPVFVLYRRLFDAPLHRNFSKACWAGLGAAFLLYMHTFPLTAIVCAPRPGHSFIDTDTFNRCSKALPDAIVQGAGNILLDAYALILPQPIIWKLKLSLQKKLNIALVFGVGSIALIASCISMYYRVQLKVGTDTDWNEGAYDVTSTVELNIAIICSCAPGVWRLIRRGKESNKTNSSGGNNNNSSNSSSNTTDNPNRTNGRRGRGRGRSGFFAYFSLPSNMASLLGRSRASATTKTGSTGNSNSSTFSSSSPKDGAADGGPYRQYDHGRANSHSHSLSNLSKNAAQIEGVELV